YVDGKEVAEKDVPGSLDEWDEEMLLTIGNELTGDRPWLGEIHLVALYGVALTREEVARNFAAGKDARIDADRITTDSAASVEMPEEAARTREQHDPKGERFFAESVAPILRDRCLECHRSPKKRARLDLSTRVAVFPGGKSGAAIVA